MRKLRIATVAVAATAVFGATSAFANSASFIAKGLGAGAAVVSTCDFSAVAGWTYTFTQNASGQATAVTISGMNVACKGGVLSVTTTDSSGGNAETADAVQIPTGTGSSCGALMCTQVVTLASAEYPANLTELHAVVTGP